MGKFSVRAKVRFMLTAAGFAFIWVGISAPGTAIAYDGGSIALNISPQIASDNHRYVAFQRRNRVPVVLDTFTGKIRWMKGAVNCQPRAIGGNRVLLICPHQRSQENDSGFRVKTGSVRGGPTKRLPRSRDIDDAYEIGKYWVSVYRFPRHSGSAPSVSYLNWRKGTFKSFFPDEDTYNGLDLSSRRLKPIKVKNFMPELRAYPDPFAKYPTYCRGENVVVTDWKKELRLWWTRDSSVRLGAGNFESDLCDWYESLRIGPETVTWSRGRGIYAYNYITGERFKRRYEKSGVMVTPVRDGVVVARKIRKLGRFNTVFRVKLIRF